MYCCLIVK